MTLQNFFTPKKLRHALPFLIAVALALIVTVLYILSGRGSLDLNTQTLERSDKVKEITMTNHNSVVITCKNGQRYEIVYQPGQNNFENLVYDKCGK